MKNITTLISHDKDCCGCLIGEIDKEKDIIEFYCNECNDHAGYIRLSTLKESLKDW